MVPNFAWEKTPHGDGLKNHTFLNITTVKSVSVSEPSNTSSDHSELFSLPPASLEGGGVGYLNQAATELTAAMEREKEGEFSCAIRGYRTAVDILITGVQGERMYERVEEDGLKKRIIHIIHYRVPCTLSESTLSCLFLHENR